MLVCRLELEKKGLLPKGK